MATRLGASRVLVVTDPGVKTLPFFGNFTEGLQARGLEVRVFHEVSPDPLEEEILAGAGAAGDFGADSVIGIGGGSPMDAAKAIAILATSKKPIAGLYGFDRVREGRLPLGLIPTTAGTGSEGSPYAVITRPTGEKISITDLASFPDVAILDPELTVSLPPRLTAATGIDAIVHAIEAFTSKGNKAPRSDTLAVEALGLLMTAVPAALKDGNDLTARQDALYGAYLAGQAIGLAPVGGIHALAYPLGGLHHVHHGLSNAIMLAPVMGHNMPAAAPLYAALAGDVIPGLGGSDEAKAEALITAIQDMAAAAGLETRFSQLGLVEDDIPALAEEAMKLERLLKNNPVDISHGECRRIYEGLL